MGLEGDVANIPWSEATNWDAELGWSATTPQPLFERLDLKEILAAEHGLVEQGEDESGVHAVKGGKKKRGKNMNKEIEGVAYIDFETFMSVNYFVGKIQSVEDHPNADKLYVVKLDDGTTNGRTICAGLKPYYKPQEMEGKSVVFVENLAPRALRGITSEGMMLAADDGEGAVVLVTIDGDIKPGSTVR